MKLDANLRAIRQAIADYMYAEGCSCCRNSEKWDEAKSRLAKLLKVPAYSDNSGFDFYRFRTAATQEGKK